MTNSEFLIFQAFAAGAIATAMNDDKDEWDIWLNLTKHWDLNIYFNGESITGMVYPVNDGLIDTTEGYQVFPVN